MRDPGAGRDQEAAGKDASADRRSHEYDRPTPREILDVTGQLAPAAAAQGFGEIIDLARGVVGVLADRAGALPVERLHRIAHHAGDRGDLVGGAVALLVHHRGGLVANRADDLGAHVLGVLDHLLGIHSAGVAGSGRA